MDMELKTFFVFIVMIGICTGFLGKHFKRMAIEPSTRLRTLPMATEPSSRLLQTAPGDPDFAVRTVKSRLPANSLRGEVEAEVEVRDHRQYDLRWYTLVRDSSTEYFVPLASTVSHDVYTLRYWSDGKAYLGSQIIFHPLPSSSPLRLMLEVAYKGYGPTLRYHFQPPITTGYHAQTKVQHPELLEMVSYPASPVHHSPGTELELMYEVKSRHPITVDVERGEVSESSMDLVVMESISDLPLSGELLEVTNRSLDGDWTLTKATLRLSQLAASDQRMYRVVFTGQNAAMSVPTQVLPTPQQSIFSGSDMRMSLESCDPQSKVKDDADGAKFEFQAETPNCVFCYVSHVGPINLELYDRQYFPVGGGPTHAVYITNSLSDIARLEFIVYGQTYQSYTFDGTYTCSATSLSDGATLERTFEIVNVRS